MIYDKAQSIINNQKTKFSHIIWDNQQMIPQIDLFKIHHFDNKAKSTSLKVLEFNMRSNSIEGLPFEIGTYLNKPIGYIENYQNRNIIVAYL